MYRENLSPYFTATADDCPADVLAEHAKHPADSIRKEVARNNNTPAAVLSDLSNDPSPSVRLQVARNNSADVSTLTALANDENNEVRRWLAFNGNCPPSILELLSSDSSYKVREAVAYNSQTPMSLLNRLKNDAVESVVWCVALNPVLPVEIQQKLFGRRNKHIDHRLAHNTGTDDQILRGLYAGSSDPTLIAVLIGNTNTPASILSEFVSSYKDSIEMKFALQAAAWHRRISTADLEALSKSKYARVARQVAKNPLTPTHILQAWVDNPPKRNGFGDIARYATWSLERQGEMLTVPSKTSQTIDGDIRA